MPLPPNTSRFVLKGIYWNLLHDDGYGRREEVRRRSPRNDKLVGKIMSALDSGKEHFIRLDWGYTGDATKHRTYRVVKVSVSEEGFNKTYVSANGESMTIKMDEPHYVIEFEDVSC